MKSAMNVRVVVLIIMSHRIEHCPGLLRRRRIVEVNERMAVNRLVQNRKIVPDRFPIDITGGNLVHV